jgi:hypothetical protein
MINTKIIVTGALLAVIAALFQSVPVFFSEMLVLLTVFSAVPIYISSRINPKAGILSYFVAAILITLISTHEALLFLCTNGIVGVTLGISCYYTNKRAVIWLTSSLALTTALSIAYYGIGIPVFGAKLPGATMLQLGIILFFSLVYNIVYYYFSVFVFRLLKRHFPGQR